MIMMTHLAPVTMATRPCKSSRSRSGEILDAAPPIVARLELQKSGNLFIHYVQHCVREALWHKVLGSEIIRNRFDPLQGSSELEPTKVGYSSS